MKKFITLFFFLMSSYFLLAKSIISEEQDYVEICKKASMSPEFFSSFRSHPAIIRVIDTVNKNQGLQYLYYIMKQSPEYLSKTDLINTYESIGTPLLCDFKSIGMINPTTLRYLKVTSDLIQLFGALKSMRIIEIGGGYGGLAAIISLFEGMRSYTIIDLSEVLSLATVFLDKLDISNIKTVNPSELDTLEEYDLVISNYAFSEIDRKHQLEYLKQLITKVPRGYMILNFIGTRVGIQSLSLEEIKLRLESAGYTISITPESPRTDDANTNVLLTWKPS